MFKIAICDDRAEQMEHLEKMINEYQKERDIYFEIFTFNNGFNFLESLSNSFDICFLDIIMPDITGMDVAKEVRKIDKETEIVFVTSSIDFAVVGYQVRASNYLLKPISREDFFTALDDVVERIKLKKSICICVNTDVGIKRISVKSVVMTEADKHCTIITLRNKDKIYVTMRFGEICEMLLEDKNFYVVSRSIIVNLETVLGTENDMLLMETGDKIVMPRRRKQEITTVFLNFSTKGLQ